MLGSVARFFLFLLLSAAAFFLLSELYFSYGADIIGGADAALLVIVALLLILALIFGSVFSRIIHRGIWPRSKVAATLVVLLAAGYAGWMGYRVAELDQGGASPAVDVAKPIQPTINVPQRPKKPANTATAKPKSPSKTTTATKPKPKGDKKPGPFSKATQALNKGVGTLSKGAKTLSGKISNLGKKNTTAKSKSGSKPPPKQTQQAATAAPEPVEDGYPVFPANPPKASAREVIPNGFFRKDGAANPTLKQVSDKILSALDAGGYYETSFYRFREDGFALATKIEKIHEDGTPMSGTERWSANVKPRFDISFTEYLRSLFLAKTGYYRIIVFVVSSEAFSQSDEAADREAAEAWVSSGANALQKDIAKAEYTEDHLATALVYVFEKPETEPSKFAGNWLQGKTHLEKAKLWSALSQ